jgi:serine protease AprX
MTGSILRLVALVVALLMLASAAPSPTMAATRPSIAPAVSKWLSSAPASARMEVILTFRNQSGIKRLAGRIGSVERLQSVPMARAILSAAVIREIAAWSETRSIWNNEEQPLHLDEGTRMVRADKVWAGKRLKRGYDGKGVGVAVLDTGVDTLHPDLPYGTKVKKSFYIVANPAAAGEPQTFVEGARQTDTEHGHGTHVSSTVAGTGAASGGRYKGVAPGADLYVFKVGAGASVLTWWAARAFDWVIVNGKAHNIRVIQNSWGGGYGSDYDPNDPINVLSKKAYDTGIVTVFSAGNGGGPNKLGRNAVSPYVVSVGAVDKEYWKAPFSSVGRPGGDMVRDANGLYRPTVMAPGVNIVAAHSSAGFVMGTGVDPENPLYTSASGTSMAAPHVSGVVALMLQARPSLTPKHVIAILEGTATEMRKGDVWEIGAGFVNAHAAVIAAEKGQVKFAPSTEGRNPRYQLLRSGKLEGTALPGGYALLPITDAGVTKIPLKVGSDVKAIYAEIEWTVPAENLYLSLINPQGKEVAASAGLTDVPLTFRSVVVTKPMKGTWTLQVAGRINTATAFSGFWGLYRHTKALSSGTTVTTTHNADGEVSYSVDAVHDSVFHQFTVPTGTTGITARIEWPDYAQDIDMYIYDVNGKLVASSTNYNPDTGEGVEQASASGADPMAPGTFPAGTWTIEVRGYQVIDPQQYDGWIKVTRQK